MKTVEEIQKADAALQQLLALLAQTKPDLAISASPRDHNLRDVIMHLVKWQERLNLLLTAESSELLPEGYTWDNFQTLNQVFHDEAQSVSYDEALSQLKANHEKATALFGALSDEQAQNLADNFALITYKHYPWAEDMIKQSK